MPTNYTNTRVGLPNSGKFFVGDTVTDSQGSVFTCVKPGGLGGFGVMTDDAVFVASPATQVAKTLGTVPAVTGLSAVEYGAPSAARQTVITMANMSMTIPNGASEWAGQKVYTFPQGRILLLGAVCSIWPVTHSTLASTITANTSATCAVGTATNDGTLTTTKADIIPSFSWTSSGVIDTGNTSPGGPFKGTLATNGAVAFDGNTTAKDVYINPVVATNTNDATLYMVGTITLSWVFLGLY